MAKHWYVVHTYSGYENKVANDLVKTVENNGMGDLIQDVKVPIEEVVENTGVPEKVILYYLKEGRLSMVNATGLLRCEQCGATINFGRLCEKCQNKAEERIVQPMQQRMAREREAARQREMLEANRSRMYVNKGRE